MDNIMLKMFYFLIYIFCFLPLMVSGLHLNPQKMKETKMLVSETSKTLFLQYELKMAGVKDNALVKEYADRLLNPTINKNVKWSEVTLSNKKNNLIENIIAAYITAKSSNVSGENTFAVLAKNNIPYNKNKKNVELILSLEIYLQKELPIVKIPDEDISIIDKGLTGTLSSEEIKYLKQKLITYLNERIKEECVDAPGFFVILKAYINQTGDLEVLQKMWDSGKYGLQSLALITVSYAYNDKELTNFGVNCIKEMAYGDNISSDMKDAIKRGEGLIFLQKQRPDSSVAFLIRKLINEPGRYHKHIYKIVRLLSNDVDWPEWEAEENQKSIQGFKEELNRRIKITEDALNSYTKE